MSDVRAVAAQSLDRIARGGVSLRGAFLENSKKLADSRDRALLSALLHDGARWWLRFDAALDRLMDQSLRQREPQIHALLVLGLVQISIMGLPEYAAVAATVEAARSLRKPKFANLVNAVLRRFLRERRSIESALDTEVGTRHAFPHWLIDAIESDWPERSESIFAASNAQAPLTLRINTRRGQRSELAGLLAAADHPVQPHVWVEDALVLADSTDVTRLPGYAEGRFSVQDAAAQLAPELLDLRPGLRVLDACAAPGGKTCHLLERADVQVLALDRDEQRLPTIRDSLMRLGLKSEVRAGDATQPKSWWDGKAYDRILLDAPCSATGVIRRQPDIRLHRRASDLPALTQQQAHLLDALWRLLAPGGRLVYATCSILRRENSIQIARFLERSPDARALDVIPHRFGHADGAGRQNLPGDDAMDGFFYAVLEKAI
ncbi:MAG: 16S rRNA (cytosine(967)-C(5))-methyltransferase RsmB [Tahibacter sp.]